MNTIIFVTLLATAALASPFAKDDAIVDVEQDTHGYYKYTLTSKNITRVEERQHDGSVKGSYSYIDDNGDRQTIEYSSGPAGFVAQGSTVPVDLPEVTEARRQHEIISEKIKSYLPALKSDFTVDEEPEVELTKEEFLAAVTKVLNPDIYIAVPETDEVVEAKKEFFKSFSQSLE